MIDIGDLNIRAMAEMAKRINEDIARAFGSFGQGGWINHGDVGATGMAAVLLQAKIAGLETALTHIRETEELLLGRGQKREKRA